MKDNRRPVAVNRRLKKLEERGRPICVDRPATGNSDRHIGEHESDPGRPSVQAGGNEAGGSRRGNGQRARSGVRPVPSAGKRPAGGGAEDEAPRAVRLPAMSSPAPDSPSLDAQLDRQLDPRVVGLWRMQGLLRLVFAGLPTSVAVGFGLGRFLSVPLGVGVASTLLLFHLGRATVWPALAYRAYRFSLREHDLLVQSGVLYRRWSSVPLSRIQHVDTRQGPV